MIFDTDSKNQQHVFMVQRQRLTYLNFLYLTLILTLINILCFSFQMYNQYENSWIDVKTVAFKVGLADHFLVSNI